MSLPQLQLEIRQKEIAHENPFKPPLIPLLSLLDKSLIVSFLSFRVPTLTRPFFVAAPVRFFFVTIVGLLVSIDLITDTRP